MPVSRQCNPGQDQSQGKGTVETLSQKWGFWSSSRPRRQGGHAVCKGTKSYKENSQMRTPRCLKGFRQRLSEVGGGKGEGGGSRSQRSSSQLSRFASSWPPITFIPILPSFRCSIVARPCPRAATLSPWLHFRTLFQGWGSRWELWVWQGAQGCQAVMV